MRLQHDVELSQMNTLRLPSCASYFVEAGTEDELYEAVDWARSNKQAFFVLGEGSNVVLPRRLDALVLRYTKADMWEVSAGTGHVKIAAAAGACWHDLVRETLARGLYGLENLALIPGTVGAAPIQNIGAYGVELHQFVDSVRALDTHSMEWQELSAEECGFAYRDSRFRRQGQRFIISEVRLRLTTQARVDTSYRALRDELEKQGINNATPQDVFDAVVRVRNRKLPNPASLPNAGSFFKNPILDPGQYEVLASKYPDIPAYPQSDGSTKVAAAWMIERAGLKGRTLDGVGMHKTQALVLVNSGGADGNSVLRYGRLVQDSVEAMFNISLEREPLLLEEDGSLSDE